MKFMKDLVVIAMAMMFLVLVPETEAGTEPVNLKGQSIIGHEVVSSDQGLSEVEFSTAKKVPGGKFLVFIPDTVLAGQNPIACIFWPGDDINRRLKKKPSRIINIVFRMTGDLDCIMVIRPHGANKRHWRSLREIRLQLALVEYIHQTFGVEKFELRGHSGGGIIAIAVAQERSHLAANVGLAAPKLAVKNHYRRYEGGVPGRYHNQYDPIYHIGKLSPDISVWIVYDPTNDRVVKPGGVLPYIDKALELGLNKVMFIESHNGHHNVDVLGWHLRRLEN